MDATDKKILNILLEGKSPKYKEIAKQLGITIGTVHNRIKAMESGGIILRTVPVVNTNKLGYDVVALINISIKGGHLEKLEQKFARHKNVCSVYDVTGDFDSLIIGKFKDTSELNAFVKKILAEEYVVRTNTSLILNAVKESVSPGMIE